MNQRYLLDTNVPSELARPLPETTVVEWISQQNDLHLSAISMGEIRRGISLLATGRRRSQLEDWFDRELLPLVADRILPVTQTVAVRWGVLSAERKTQGLPLAMADGLIAATALEFGLTLVTRNVKDFNGLALQILNPWDRQG